MAPGCNDCIQAQDRIGALESEFEKLRLEFQHYREVREAEELIDSYYQNTVNELHTERDDVIGEAPTGAKHTAEDIATSSKVISAPQQSNNIATSTEVIRAPQQIKKNKKELWARRRSPPPLLRSLDSSSTSTGNTSLSSPITPLRMQSPAHIFNIVDFPPLPTNNKQITPSPANNNNNENNQPGKSSSRNNSPKIRGKAKRKTKHTTISQFGLSNPNANTNHANIESPRKYNKSIPPAATACQTTVNTLLIGDGAVRGIRLANTITRYYCGGTISTVTHVLPHLLLQYPQCHSVIVHIGANDVLRGHPSSKIESDFGDLIELARRHNKILFLSGPLPRTGGSSACEFQLNGHILQLNRYLEWKARMRPNSLGGFSGHYHTHWKMPWLFTENGSLNGQGKKLLQNNIRKIILNSDCSD